MKKIYILAILALAATVVVACGSEERRKASKEKVTSVVQEAVGNATDDQELKNKSKKNSLKSDLRSTKEDIKDMVTPD